MENEKLVPLLRFGEFKEDWKKQHLSELLDFKNGINASKEAYGSGYKFINVLDIINNDFITHDDIIGSVEVSENEFNKNIVEYGDILFQRSSETRQEVGQSTVYLDKNEPATFGGFVIRGKKISDYDPAFLNFLLKSASARKEITSKSGGSTRYNIGQATLSEVVVLTPTEIEQQKIADFLTQTDKSLQLLQDKKTGLETYKKGVMQKLFSRELRFKDENGEDFPEWEEKSLKEISNVVMGQSPSSSSYNTEGLGVYLIQGNADISNRQSSPRQWTNNPTRECKPGDLLLTVRAPVGTIAKSIHNACIGRGVCAITNKKNSDIEYIYQYLLYFEPRWVSIEQGSTFTAVSGSDIKNLKLKTPSLTEQQKIANFLTQIDQKIEKTGKQIEEMEVFKKGLLQQMFV